MRPMRRRGPRFTPRRGCSPPIGSRCSHALEQHPTGKRLAVLTLTALGVVYGDIGTSPLYALKECFSPQYGLEADRENIFGVLSLIVWALTLVVTVKYVSFILRADNRGEGGTLRAARTDLSATRSHQRQFRRAA